MNLQQTLLSNVIAVSLGLSLAGTAAAERVFPPPHLHPDAQFESGVNNGGGFDAPWYEANDAERLRQLTDREVVEPSPYPSLYYHYSIRGYGNDESANLTRIREQANERRLVARDAAEDQGS